MATQSPTPKKPVIVVELPEFDEEAQRRLDPNTLRALHLLLAENPLAGKARPDYPELLELEFANERILYVVGSQLAKVYLIRFLKPNDPLPPPTSPEGKALRKALSQLIKAGILLVLKEVLKEPARKLWEIIKNLFL